MSLGNCIKICICGAALVLLASCMEDTGSSDEFCGISDCPGGNEMTFELDTPSRAAIQISNDTGEEQFVGININNKLFFNSTDQIVGLINPTQSSASNQQIAKGIWEFVRDNRYHFPPITGRGWGHSPVLLINSLGFGICDDAAAVIAFIAKRAGLESRVWALNGHLVSEIRVDGKWQMFDGDYGVYFENSAGEIAGVEELSANPELILNPLNPMNITPSPYTESYARLFTSSEDNGVTNGYDSTIPAREQIFRIPSNGTIEFPGVYAAPLFALGLEVTDYSNLKQTLPQGFSGFIDNFLVLHTIRGQGRVKLAGMTFELPSASLQSAIENRDNFIHEIEIIESNSDIEIIYLLNPIRARLEYSNTLIISGPGAFNVAAALVDL